MSDKQRYSDYTKKIFEKINEVNARGEIGEKEQKKIEAEIAEDISKKISHDVDIEFKRKIIRSYFWIVILIFVISYGAVIYFLKEIFETENCLIRELYLDPKDRSINSTTISIIIAATITQVGAAFFAISKYLFSHKDDKDNSYNKEGREEK